MGSIHEKLDWKTRSCRWSSKPVGEVLLTDNIELFSNYFTDIIS